MPIKLFREVLYAENEADLSDRLEEMYADPTVLKYPQFLKHLIKDTFPKVTAGAYPEELMIIF